MLLQCLASFLPVAHLCKTKLPTVDFRGRLRLSKVCPRCSQELPHDAVLGKKGEFRLAIVGAMRSSKSNLLFAFLWHLEQEFTPANGWSLRFSTDAEEAVYRRCIAGLQRGEAITKTLRDQETPTALTVEITLGNDEGCILYLYDAAGEDFEAEFTMRGHPLETYDGIIFVVDPFGETSGRVGLLADLDITEVAKANPSRTSSSLIAERLFSALERRLQIPPGQTIRLPVAVVVTKLDVAGLGRRRRIGLREMNQTFATLLTMAQFAERDHDRVRRLLLDLDLGSLVQLLEHGFSSVRFFGASPLGRSLDASNTSSFQPRGVLAPFLWLCHEIGALADVELFDYVFINAHLHLIRCLRGLEGNNAQQGARRLVGGCLGAFLGTMLLLFVLLPTMLFILAGGFQVVALLFLYAYLLFVLIYQQ